MQYFTTIDKLFHCPEFDIDIYVTGKYKLLNNNSKAVFCNAFCPIFENSKLPVYEQLENYKYYKCLKFSSCAISNVFEKTIYL